MLGRGQTCRYSICTVSAVAASEEVRVQRQVPLSLCLFPPSDQLPLGQHLVLDFAPVCYLCCRWPCWVTEHKHRDTRPSRGF